MKDRTAVEQKRLDTDLWIIPPATLVIPKVISAFLAIYGLLLVKRRTGCAWGCVFAFCFIWNAF
jgi:hypothetical protein